MKALHKILVPTDLSEGSRRGLRYACSLAAEEKAEIVVLHVANEFKAWEMFSDDLGVCPPHRQWPIDRVVAEATLDMNRFLEPHVNWMRAVPKVSKRVVLGAVFDQILSMAEVEDADLIVMSPRRKRKPPATTRRGGPRPWP